MTKNLSIFVWENNGISSSWHDDGTLAVLAESPEQAREIVRADRALAKEYQDQENEIHNDFHHKAKEGDLYGKWTTPAGKALLDERDSRIHSLRGQFGHFGHEWDGSESALDEEPTFILGSSVPQVITFNGGGYD